MDVVQVFPKLLFIEKHQFIIGFDLWVNFNTHM